MPPRKKAPPVDLLGSFVDTLAQTTRRTNVYRFEPLPQQELFLQSQKKGRILFGGNRGGKTHGNVADSCLVLTRRHPYRQALYPQGPLRFRMIGVDFERGIDQGLIPKLQELLPPSFLINGSWEDSYSRSQHLLTLEDNSTVSLMSYEQDANKFQIVSLHHTLFDEEPPKAIFDEDMLRHVDVAGTWSLSETPVQQLEWVQDELIEPAESGLRDDIAIFYLDTRENTYLPENEIRDLVKNLSAEEAVIRLQGRYKAGSLVFPEFERKFPFVVPEESFRLTPEHAVYESMDHGYVNPTSWNWTAVSLDGQITVFKQLYSSNLVVSEWAKAVKQMRKEICSRFGMTLDVYMEDMLKGTFGDPAIADSGNAAAQTGITIQQAYAAAGVYISTGNVRQARAADQNIGLDMFHTYMRMRPDRRDVPWMQITDNCTALIDELKKARKPKQTSALAAVKNASEQIRDKDNHAIDAEKYLFIITLDLRPPRFRSVDRSDDFEQYKRENLRIAPTQFDKDPTVWDSTSVSHNPWHVRSSDSYSSLEE